MMLNLAGQFFIFNLTVAQRLVQPLIIATGVNLKSFAQQSNRIGGTTSFYQRIAFFDSLAKNTAASFKISRSCSARLSSRFNLATSACKSASFARTFGDLLNFLIQSYKLLLEIPKRLLTSGTE